jgi:hypothetical protein
VLKEDVGEIARAGASFGVIEMVSGATAMMMTVRAGKGCQLCAIDAAGLRAALERDPAVFGAPLARVAAAQYMYYHRSVVFAQAASSYLRDLASPPDPNNPDAHDAVRRAICKLARLQHPVILPSQQQQSELAAAGDWGIAATDVVLHDVKAGSSQVVVRDLAFLSCGRLELAVGGESTDTCPLREPLTLTAPCAIPAGCYHAAESVLAMIVPFDLKIDFLYEEDNGSALGCEDTSSH